MDRTISDYIDAIAAADAMLEIASANAVELREDVRILESQLAERMQQLADNEELRSRGSRDREQARDMLAYLTAQVNAYARVHGGAPAS